MSKPNTFIHLHTYDLRIHDSRSLFLAHDPSSDLASQVTHFLPLYIFDERQLDVSRLPNASPPVTSRRSRVADFHRTSPHRLKFLLEAVFGLREAYRRSGGDLLIGYGKPEVLVPNLIRRLQQDGSVEGVWTQLETTTEEVNMQSRLKDALGEISPKLKLSLNDSRSLVPLDILPFDPKSDTPDVYTAFRKKVEGLEDRKAAKELVVDVKGRKLKSFPKLGKIEIPSGKGGWIQADDKMETIYAELVAPLIDKPPIGGWSEAVKGQSVPPIHNKSAIPLGGSEAEGLGRLDDYVGHASPNGWNGGEKAKTYKQTRNGLVGEAFSNKLSGHLALGSLSARAMGWRVGELHQNVKKDSAARGNVYWIIFELLWRDFFQFTTMTFSTSKTPRHPSNSTLFDADGFSSQMSNYPSDKRPKPEDWHKPNWDDPNDPARRWCEGRTGIPFIDANMRELRETGWMSNRGRQNVASFLVKDLYVDWRVGAEFFEMHLVDYDTCSNWGNWQYQAGVGNDPRSDRQFNPIKQAFDYDPQGEYVRLWMPELKDVSDRYLHFPWGEYTSRASIVFSDDDGLSLNDTVGDG
ncbi:DNA photolyase, FAD-binding/Cryptochrome [Naematelia encephala]|uniref:Cryptochrome DASH n=1 Tax=Naematelia encephala TaxID=71784 RepID=A0A1Y2BLI0_9TREE|nr:DNA photolyase, FAD-binding/Cryptochrome [Naematelia encephala]